MHRRTVAAALAGTMLAHWLWVGQPLVGLGVASLVLAGERVAAVGFTLEGGFAPRVAVVGATVAVCAVGYGALTGTPTGGALVASLVLVATWLSGPNPPSLGGLDTRRDGVGDRPQPEE